LKEEELRGSGDPKHSHLQEDLHVEVTAFASPAEAHARLALALSEVRKYLIPDGNDEIRQRQMKEIKILKKQQDKTEDKTDERTNERTHTAANERAQDTANERTDDSGQESDVSCSPSEPSHPTSPTTSPSPPAGAGTTASPTGTRTSTSPPPSDKQSKLYDPRSKSILEKIQRNREGEGAVARPTHILEVTAGTPTQIRDLAARNQYRECTSSPSILEKILPLQLSRDRLKRDFDAVLPAILEVYEQPMWKKIK